VITDFIQEPHEYCFAGNPVVFELMVDSDNLVNVEVIFNNESKFLSYRPYKVNDQYRVYFDLYGLLSLGNTPVDYTVGEIIAPLSGFSLLYTVKIDDEYTFTGIAFRGGITKRAIEKLTDNKLNIFSARLGSHFDNFLFTIRTNAKEIKIRDTELYPFVFINPKIDFVFKSGSGNIINVPADTINDICVLDVQALIDMFALEYEETLTSVDVMPAGQEAFKITIVPGQISEERYKIKFRNSIGAFEVVEVTGIANIAPEFSEENTFETLTSYNFFKEMRDRVLSREVINVETGYKTREELSFILDMIKSDESYFIFPNGQYFQCKVSADNPAYRYKMVTPTSFALQVTDVYDEEFSMPDMEYIFGYDRYFDEHYSDNYE